MCSTNIDFLIYYFLAPCPVLNLVNSTWFTSIVLTWDPPNIPNGIIIRYEVTYRIGGGNIQTLITGLNTAFTISPLETGTRVSDVSVSAYTSVGRGVPSNLTDLRTLSEPRELLWWSTSMYIMNVSVAMVMNIRVEMVTSTSARVSWDTINMPGISGYIVYYTKAGNSNEQSVSFAGSSAATVYQFASVAVQNLNGIEILGPRPAPLIMRIAEPITSGEYYSKLNI